MQGWGRGPPEVMLIDQFVELAEMVDLFFFFSDQWGFFGYALERVEDHHPIDCLRVRKSPGEDGADRSSGSPHEGQI